MRATYKLISQDTGIISNLEQQGITATHLLETIKGIVSMLKTQDTAATNFL